MQTPELAHLAFFETAGDQTEEQPSYRAAVAGLLSMRLVDRWVMTASGDRPATLRELESVRRAIELVDAGPIREVLRNLDAALTISWGKFARQVPVVLSAYAGILKKEEVWTCAADVYATVTTMGPLCEANDLVPPAYLDMAYCFRMIGGRLAEAERAYGRAGAIANLQGDEYHALLSRVGMANVYVDRGNLPAAQEALDALIAEVSSCAPGEGPLRDVLARARHGRGHVAYQRKDFRTAAACFHAAVDEYSDEARRSRALIDLGTTMVDLALPDAARDAFSVARTTAPESFVRLAAGLNLMRLAFLRDEQTVFERLRYELASMDLPAHLEATYHQLAGEGLYRFGRDEAARVELDRAIDLATHYQLNQVRLESEAVLTEIVLKRPVRTTLDTFQPSVALEPVVRALRDMRERAGV